MTQEQKDRIGQVLEANNFAVIATNSASGYPESSLVGFSNTENGDIVFRSLSNSRKNQNIKENSNIFVVIGFGQDSWATIQIEGIARLVIDPTEKAVLEDSHCQKIKAYEKFRDNEMNEYFVVEVSWLRYTNLSTSPAEVWEVKNDL
jgi:general stress protein 26